MKKPSAIRSASVLVSCAGLATLLFLLLAAAPHLAFWLVVLALYACFTGWNLGSTYPVEPSQEKE